MPSNRDFDRRRQAMVDAWGPMGLSKGVLSVMRTIPRHLYVPPEAMEEAYEDHPLSIGQGQTISQPSLVAMMTETLGLTGSERVLEVGTGSGYQTAILAELAAEVFTTEIVPELARAAADRLERLNHRNVHCRLSDGHWGWPEKAPFDAILVTAAPASVPQALLEQLAVGGILVIPVGEVEQTLLAIRRTPDGFEREPLLAVRFVPMVHEAGGRRPRR